MKKSLDKRLYEAWRSASGVRLNAHDVIELLHDNAMQTRIANGIAREYGFDEPGAADPAVPVRLSKD